MTSADDRASAGSPARPRLLGHALLLGAIVLVGGGVFLLAATTQVAPGGRFSVGKVPAAAASCAEKDCLPDLEGTALDGTRIARAALAGKVVLVNFWAPWCAPCVAEIPALEAVYRRHRAEGLLVLGVHVDQSPDEELRDFLGARGATYPSLRSTPELEGAFGSPEALPSSFLYDRDGKRRSRWRGGISEAALEAELAGVLEPAR